MNDSDILKRLIQAEKQAKAIINDAEKAVSENIEKINRTKQEEFRLKRESKHLELEKEFKTQKLAQDEKRKEELSAFQNSLKAEIVDETEASRVVKDILKVL